MLNNGNTNTNMTEDEQNIASEYTALKERLKKLKVAIEEREIELGNMENAFMNTAVTTAHAVNQLHEVEKKIGVYGKAAQGMGKGYFLLTAITTEVNVRKRGDPTEVQRVSIWTRAQNRFIRDKIYEEIQDLYKDGEQNS